MILLLAGIIEGIIGFLGFIAMALVVFYLMTLVSKLFNMKIVSKTGRPVADPNSFDNINKGVKESYKKALSRIKKVDFSSYSTLKNSSSNKINKLNTITELYEKGLISKSEFNNLKKEIL